MSEIPTRQRGRPGYPESLETIADPPARLWVLGSIPEQVGVAIVGTRRATRYGLSLARDMGAAVGAAGWPVVSGLARGIDGAAHRGCVEVGGTGVAVLGCGVDIWYPREHQQLGESLIAGGGAVISEYPPGTHPEPWRFPARNRIISGLSAVVVVVEAAEKGGALITARLAAEHGREVFAFPGDVSRRTSVGTNLLIRDGALPVLGSDDLIEALSLVMGPPPAGARKDREPLEIDIPVGGATLEEVIEANGGDAGAVLATLGRLEAAGKIGIESGEVSIR
ncbi:MAG TPA: DNA-processing protein DprA [Acidimicrobiia bacterium]|nr:DNA-processing protein DprA [Acidimicrobiia bacterium]